MRRRALRNPPPSDDARPANSTPSAGMRSASPSLANRSRVGSTARVTPAAMPTTTMSPGGAAPVANQLAQTGQHHGQGAEPAADGSSTSSPSTGAAASSEESTPWLDHHESYGVGVPNPQAASLAFAIPTGPASVVQEDEDMASDVEMDDSPSSANPALHLHLSQQPEDADTDSDSDADSGSDADDVPMHMNLNVDPGTETDAETDNGGELSVASSDSAASSDDSMDQLMPSTTNPVVLGSENLPLGEFLRAWAHFGPLRAADGTPASLPEHPLDIRRVRDELAREVFEVEYKDLQGDKCDLQGLGWSYMGTSRIAARARREASYRNYVNRDGSDILDHSNQSDTHIPPSDDYFRFRRMLIRSDIHLAHFQLRSVFACTSRSQLFYPTRRGICRLNPTSREGAVALDLGRFQASNNSITTLDANCGVLVAGTFLGDYVAKSLHSSDKDRHTEGSITTGPMALTNHVQVHPTRYSHRPVATFSSNDYVLRAMDIETGKFITSVRYEYPFNCTAISPDFRLRLHVGDESAAGVCCAETGKLAVALGGHRDYGFACDWSQDGIHVATGSQDKRIKIWDARKWTDSSGNGTPLASIWCEMAGARNLRFSPPGSGAPVLVAAEEADYVTIIDLKTLDRKQTIDVFGELGGVTFADGGDELNILVSDSTRGGVIQLDHCKLDTTDFRPAASRFIKDYI